MTPKIIDMLLDVFESDETLAAETALSDRASVLDFIAQAETYLQTQSDNPESAPVASRLANFKRHLTGLNTRLFERLRTQIRARAYTPAELRLEFNRYTAYTPEQQGQDHVGLDALDALLDGLTELEPYAQLDGLPDPDMNPYYPTPARAVLDTVDSAGLQPGDVFYDLGSGLGRVVILAHLVSGARAKGVEINRALHERAALSGSKLGLTGVEFIHADVRKVDYADGTVFFMYAPLKRSIFQELLDKLHQAAQTHPIRICSLGPCTAWVAEQPWLQSEAADPTNPSTVVIFYNRPDQA